MSSQTGFLFWKNPSKDLYVAKDPVDPLKRWIIREVGGHSRYRAFSVAHNGKTTTESYVLSTDFLERAKWECVGECIKKLGETLYTNSVNLDVGMDFLIQGYEFLDGLTKKFKVETPNEQPPTVSVGAT